MSILRGCMESSFAKPWISCKVPFYLLLLFLTVAVLYASGFHNYSKVLIKPLLNQEKQLNCSILVIIAIYKSCSLILILLQRVACVHQTTIITDNYRQWKRGKKTIMQNEQLMMNLLCLCFLRVCRCIRGRQCVDHCMYECRKILSHQTPYQSQSLLQRLKSQTGSRSHVGDVHNCYVSVGDVQETQGPSVWTGHNVNPILHRDLAIETGPDDL